MADLDAVQSISAGDVIDGEPERAGTSANLAAAAEFADTHDLADFSDAMGNEVVVVDRKGQSYDSVIATGVGCTQFPDTERLAPGATGLGCVLFQVPVSAKIAEVQVTLDSGHASQTGQWRVGR